MALAALVAAAMWAGMASAAVYEVGDKLGWTIMGNPDYGAWAASKKFSVGDTVGTPLAFLTPLTVTLTHSAPFSSNFRGIRKRRRICAGVNKPHFCW